MNREFLLAILLLALIILPVQGAIQRPAQGDAVLINTYVDVTGVMGFGGGFAYYGMSGDTESNPLYIIEMTGRKSEYYNFFIDPKIFETRLGPWYQYTGNTTGSIEHGNLLAFRVVKTLPVVNVTPTGPTVAPTPKPETQLIEPKPFGTDFQIAYSDVFTLPVNTKQPPPRLWVFGRIDGIYNKTFAKQVAYLTAAEVQGLETGTYTVMTQFPGKNTIFEVGYSKIIDVQNSKTVEQLTSPWVAVKPINIYGVQPRDVMTKYREMIKGTDDVVTEYRLEVAHPTIDIRQIDETYWAGKDVLDIRGYTNVAKGTVLDIVMDKGIRGTGTTTVQGDTANQWRYFQIYLPIDYESVPVGQHDITITAPQGASQTVPFYVYDLPKGQETPNETIKYVAGDIFYATPTPEVVTVIQTQIVTQTIYVPVTPNDEQVYAAQKKASDANWTYWMTTIGILALVGTIISAGSWYLWRVVKRARKLK